MNWVRKRQREREKREGGRREWKEGSERGKAGYTVEKEERERSEREREGGQRN